MGASETSLYLAAQVWCDDRVSDRQMDAELAMVFAETLDQMRDELLRDAKALAKMVRGAGIGVPTSIAKRLARATG